MFLDRGQRGFSFMWFDTIDLDPYRNLHRRNVKSLININPIQTGGRVPPESRHVLEEFADGYSVCDYCGVPGGGRLDLIKDPPVCRFIEDLAKFIDMDSVRLVHGAREGILAVMHSVAKLGDTVIIDGLAHYTTYVAAEREGLSVVEVPHSGYPLYNVTSNGFDEKIGEVKKNTGKKPSLVILSHADYEFGNLANAQEVGKIAKEHDVPFLLNCACTVGRMPVSGREMNADFVVASGHKSMASSGPAGFLATNSDYEELVFRKSTIQGQWSKKTFKKKEVEFLGCTLRGLPVVSMMTSFPHVVHRIREWEEEIKKARWFAARMEEIEGIEQLGDKPHNHDITCYNSPSFARIAEKHKRRGFFIYDELKERGIVGLEPGLSKSFHLSTYLLTWDQVKHVAEAFKSIAEKNSIPCRQLASSA